MTGLSIRSRKRVATAVAAALCLAVAAGAPARAEPTLAEALAAVAPGELVPGADRYGAAVGTPPAAPAYRGQALAGYAFLNTDAAAAVGYSGKPIHILLGMDPAGTLVGARLYRHSEPIVLTGIPESRVASFIGSYVGRGARAFERASAEPGRVPDLVSGATVTAMVIDDAIARASLRMARALGLAGLAPAPAARPPGRLAAGVAESGDWLDMLGGGAVRRLRLDVGRVSADFARAGKEEAAARPESGDPRAVFIDLYAALATVPAIGRGLLGEAAHERLAARLGPDRHALLVAANGLYSFKGSGYVRGGIFDRIRLVQGDASFRFRDRDHERLGGVAAEHAQAFREIGLFALPAGAAFDPTAPWRLELLANRAVGALDKDFLSYDLEYALPERYIARDAPAPAPEAAAVPADGGAPLWQRLWRHRIVDVAVLAAALAALTGLFFFQDRLARRPKLAAGVRLGFLAFTVAWIGGYAQAQLSVVNVLAFFNALVGDFEWDAFLMEPLIFMLWASVAVSLLFWGRGPFCGWLCPFGALQELLNKAARALRVPQVALPWGLHERLWPVKYVVFVALLGVSFHSLALAGEMAEVEPFKTAAVLRFAREWPYLLYAGLLLGAGLFIERFFCRYLCPLGAALAIPGKLRIFEWLKRHKECGSPCHRCAQTCMVQAIRPDGRIDPHECLYCLHCQVLYHDEHRCPPMIRRRLGRERRLALASPAMSAVGHRPLPVADKEETKP